MTIIAASQEIAQTTAPPPDHLLARIMRSGRILVGGGILGAILLLCLVTLPLTLNPRSSLYFDRQQQAAEATRQPPRLNSLAAVFGTDSLGRSLFARSLLGGTISLAVGIAAAAISVILGVAVGLISGYRGGWTDSVLMRIVDILYGLPYILLVILFKIALEPLLGRIFNWLQSHIGGPFNWSSPTQAANLVVLFSAIGLVSWLTMARVVRGQVLSLRGQPFVEAARALGLPERRIFLRHILPNLVGPIIVYATLTVPGAILQESFLSFLGIGVADPVPSWGKLAADGLLQALNPLNSLWWLLLFPCLLLVVTLLSLNFMGDGLRDVFDPRKESAKI